MTSWQRDYCAALRLLAWGAAGILLALSVALPDKAWLVIS